MWLLPSALRAKLAVVGLLGIFLIPLVSSNLRGLTHVLTCEEQTDTSFSVDVGEDGQTSILSSQVVTPDQDRSLCDGLSVDVQMSSISGDRARLEVLVTNASDHPWKGSVQVQIDRTPLPLDIGRIGSGEVGRDTVELHLRPGQNYQLSGKLLIGP